MCVCRCVCMVHAGENLFRHMHRAISGRRSHIADSEKVQHLHTRDLRSCIAMPKRIRTITYDGVRHKTVH